MHQRIFPDFHIIISLISLSLIFSACADGSLKSISPENIITGTYDLEGTQINQQICMIGCPPEREGEIMQSDTFHVSFPVEIKFYENRKDTLIFSGLEGADVYPKIGLTTFLGLYPESRLKQESLKSPLSGK